MYIMHCHSENSCKDSVMSVRRLLEQGRKIGAKAIALTDHGRMLGIFELMELTKSEFREIKPIPGVEAYIEEDDSVTKRAHLVLMAKDIQGYHAIIKASEESERRAIDDVPRMNAEILERWFGAGSLGHDHVIATSACIGGVLNKELRRNEDVESLIASAERKRERYVSPSSKESKLILQMYSRASKRVDDLIEEREKLAPLAEMKFALRERRLKVLTGEEYAITKARIDADKAVQSDAAEKLTKIKAEIKKAKTELTAARRAKAKNDESTEKYSELTDRIHDFESQLLSDEELLERTKDAADRYEALFGKGNFYIELQYHGIPAEKACMPVLAKIAREKGIPLVAANDVHIPTSSDDDVLARQIINSLRRQMMRKNPETGENIQYVELSDGDRELYMKSDEQLSEALRAILPEDVVQEAIANTKTIADACHVEFNTGLHFPKFQGDAKAHLRAICEDAIPKKYGKKWTGAHRARLETELGIIDKMGYCDYICIVQDFLDEARRIGLEDNPEGVAVSVGPGRGSAVGSIVCYLSGITNLDPIENGLIFERFLNPERASMPDIDSDFEPEVRNKVIEYVRQKYGANAVCAITTRNRLKAKAAINNAARVYSSKKYGSVRAMYPNAHALTDVLKDDNFAELKDYADEMRRVCPDEDSAEIIRYAMLIENVFFAHGTHAAGIVISDCENISDYVPLMANENDVSMLKCQVEKEPVEALGMLKMDFLGLKNLAVITETLRAVKRNSNVSVDMDQVPFDTKVFKEIFSRGKTNGVFQFESNGMKSLLKNFKPNSFSDLILLVALYRPGPLQYIDRIISVKRGKSRPNYLAKEMEPILKQTYGCMVYQEQVMEIVRTLAGYSYGRSDLVRRAMAKKKHDVMEQEREHFVKGSAQRGIEHDVANQIFDEMMDFASYAFNKSHAAAYALVAYWTAYLKYYYPCEFMAALLNHSPSDKIAAYIAEARQMGIQVKGPDVQMSADIFTGQNGTIYFGLANIAGIKSFAREILAERDRGDFLHFRDFMERTQISESDMMKLIEAGAMDRLQSAATGKAPNRASMKALCPVLKTELDKLRQMREKKSTTSEKIAEAEYRISLLSFCDVYEDRMEKLKAEEKLLGVYISGHPLDEFPAAKKMRKQTIDEIDASAAGKTLRIAGYISEIKRVTTKMGKEMCFFRINDETGSMEAVTFPKVYVRFGPMIQEGDVVLIDGKCTKKNESSREDDAEDSVICSIICETIRSLPKKRHCIIMIAKDIVSFDESYMETVRSYESTSESALAVKVIMTLSNETRELDFYVSPEIMTDASLKELQIKPSPV